MTAARLGIHSDSQTLSLAPDNKARHEELKRLAALEIELRQPPIAEIYGGQWNDDLAVAARRCADMLR